MAQPNKSNSERVLVFDHVSGKVYWLTQWEAAIWAANFTSKHGR